MTPTQRLRAILTAAGYTEAATHLPDFSPAEAEARIIQWKRWAKAQRPSKEPLPEGHDPKGAVALSPH